jgi:hypothetical protein
VYEDLARQWPYTRRIQISLLELAGDDQAKKMPRKDDTIEPVFYNSMPKATLEEIMHSLSVDGGTIDLAAGDGKLAYLHICLGKPYFGVVLTLAHLDALKLRLIHMVLGGVKTEGSAIYNPTFALKEKRKREGATTEAEDCTIAEGSEIAWPMFAFAKKHEELSNGGFEKRIGNGPEKALNKIRFRIKASRPTFVVQTPTSPFPEASGAAEKQLETAL